MNKPMLVFAIVVLFLAFAIVMIAVQYSEPDKGEVTHQRRGRWIAVLLVAALVVLEFGLHFLLPNFRPEWVSKIVHYAFSFPTGFLLIAALPFTGWRATRGSEWGERWHRRLTRFKLPVWAFVATCITGAVFITLSLSQ